MQHFTFPEPAAIVRLGMDPVWAHFPAVPYALARATTFCSSDLAHPPCERADADEPSLPGSDSMSQGITAVACDGNGEMASGRNGYIRSFLTSAFLEKTLFPNVFPGLSMTDW